MAGDVSDEGKFISVIGRGTHGIVYKVNDVNTKRVYAAKMIIPSKIKNKIIKHTPYYELMESYTEVNVMSHIKHPYIANYRQKFVANVHYKDNNIKDINTLFIIMDMADCSMRDVISSGVGIPIKCKLDYIYQLISSVAYLHLNNFFHCDIKPENMLIYGNIMKLGDMGLVTNAESFSNIIDIFICGSLSQQSPEVAADRILYHMNIIMSNDTYSLNIKNRASSLIDRIKEYKLTLIKDIDTNPYTSMYRKLKAAEIFSLGQTILQIYTNKIYHNEPNDILEIGEFLYITCALPFKERRASLLKLRGWNNDIKHIDDLLTRILDINAENRLVSCTKILNHSIFNNYKIKNTSGYKTNIWPKSHLNYISLYPDYFIGDGKHYLVKYIYSTVIDIFEFLIVNNIDLMLKTMIFTFSYIYSLFDTVYKYVVVDNSGIQPINTTIYLSIYLSIIYTHEFDFKLKDMIDLLLSYSKIDIKRETFISCLNNIFIKTNCFCPANIYSHAKNSDEILNTVSYYLQPTVMQTITPKDYVIRYRINNHRENSGNHSKNIKLNQHIIKYIRDLSHNKYI